MARHPLINPAVLAAAVRAGNQATGSAPGKGVSRPLTGGPQKGVPRPLNTNPAIGAAANASTNPMGTAAPPINPALDQAIGAIQGSRDSAISGLEAQKPQVLANYGYTATGYDANGSPLGLSFDANNPYSKASLLLKNYNQQQTGTTNSMAARGQLYSGALGNARTANQSNYNIGNDALIKALTAALVGIAGREQTARDTAETQIGQARLQYAPTS